MIHVKSNRFRDRVRSARCVALLFGLFVNTAHGQASASADSAFARSDWTTAARLYRRLASRDTADMRSHFRLGVSLFEQRQFAAALPEFERTAKAGFQRTPSEFRLTRAHALLGHIDSSIAHLERAVDAGVALELVSSNADLASIRGDARYLRIVERLEDQRFPCRRGVEAHQFDFWIGEWTVTPWAGPATAAPIGHNVVTADLEHCVLLEAWTPTAGGQGRSMNFWDTNRHAWRQMWMGADGASLDYEGQFADEAMRFTGWTLDATGKKVLQKLTFFRIAADTVRQLFEASGDGGATWQSTFDGRYARVARQP